MSALLFRQMGLARRVRAFQRKRVARVAGAAIALGLAVLCSRSAAASPSFLSVLSSEAQAKTDCTVCHSTPSGGFGTATTPFAAYLRSRGLVAASDASLITALKAARAERHDSDSDGALDVDELAKGTDPNVADQAGGATSPLSPPAYGCGARIAPHSAAPWPAGVGLAALTTVVARRLRRKRL